LEDEFAFSAIEAGPAAKDDPEMPFSEFQSCVDGVRDSVWGWGAEVCRVEPPSSGSTV